MKRKELLCLQGRLPLLNSNSQKKKKMMNPKISLQIFFCKEFWLGAVIAMVYAMGSNENKHSHSVRR